jgi:hypothetical protein
MRRFFVFPLLTLAVAAAFAEDPLVVLATDHAGRIDFFDAALSPLGTLGIGAGQRIESVAASPDGRRLYIAKAEEKTADSFGLYSLDLGTRGMCLLATPALFGAPSPDGRFLFTQGKGGVDVFDTANLARVSTMKAPGAYSLQPSPDGRWLFGVTNSPQPSLAIFDIAAEGTVRRIPQPLGPITGTWAGDRFYLFNYGGDGNRGTGWLWSVRAENGELSAARPIELPDLHGGCREPVLLALAGAPDELFLAEAFGFKVDRRVACPDAARGGVYVIHPSTGGVEYRAPSVHVNRMVVSPDSGDLYVIDAGAAKTPGSPRLLDINARTGSILHESALATGQWNLTLARVPLALIPHYAPRGRVRATTACAR